MIKELLKKGFSSLGYEVRRKVEPGWGYDLSAEAVAAAGRVAPYTMLSMERLITLYQQVAHCEKIGLQGAFVECGVWKGGGVGMMALANLKHGKARRDIHLFDAFDDICEPDRAVDGAGAAREASLFSPGGQAQGRLQPLKGFYDHRGGHGTVEGNRDLLERQLGYDPARLHFHKGWFQDTLPTDAKAVGPIALLRLDGDWHASTMVCLEHLYDLVVPGGFVVIDDYGCYEGCKKAVDEFRSRRKIDNFLNHIDETGRYWIKSGR